MNISIGIRTEPLSHFVTYTHVELTYATLYHLKRSIKSKIIALEMPQAHRIWKKKFHSLPHMERESTVYMRLLQLDRWCNIIDESLQNENKTTTTTKLNWQNQNKNKKKVSQNRVSLSFDRILCSRYNINPEGHMNFHLRQYKSSVFGVIHSLWNVFDYIHKCISVTFISIKLTCSVSLQKEKAKHISDDQKEQM